MLNIGLICFFTYINVYSNLQPISFQEAFILLVAHVIEDVHFNEESTLLLVIVILQYKCYYRQK